MYWKRSKKADAKVCCVCGIDAARGYYLNGQHYCDEHGEDAIRRQTRDNVHGDIAAPGNGAKRRRGGLNHHY